MNKLITKIAIIWCLWAVFAMAGTIFWQYLEGIGFLYVAEGNSWNGRKVVFSIMSVLFFVLTIVKTVLEINDYNEKSTETKP